MSTPPASLSPLATPRPDPTDPQALFVSLYAELCRLARRETWRHGAHDVIGAGTLVHEVWLGLRNRPELAFDGRGRFLAYASRMMRGLIIDRVRARQALKRGGDQVHTSLDAEHADEVAQPESLESVSDALDHLAIVEPELALVVDLKFFSGFSTAEIANMQGRSERTVQRQWEKARLLLHAALTEE